MRKRADEVNLALTYELGQGEKIKLSASGASASFARRGPAFPHAGTLRARLTSPSAGSWDDQKDEEILRRSRRSAG